jgi:hypothetical protein
MRKSDCLIEVTACVGLAVFLTLSPYQKSCKTSFPSAKALKLSLGWIDSKCFQIKFITNKFFFTGRCHFQLSNICITNPVKKNLFVINLIWKHLLSIQPSESFKALADGKDVFIGTKMGSGKLLSYESIPVPSLFTCDDDYLRGSISINHQVALRANFKM